MILTSAVFLIIFLIELIGLKYKNDVDNNFLDLTTSNVLRGIFCIVVIMVHLPADCTNKVQDMIGSFAFVGVTLFFMLSAYGLSISLKTKENYLKNFFKKRILVLLIPLLISIVIKVPFGISWSSGGVRFIVVLLLFYLVFYFVNRFIKWQHKNLIIVLFVLLYSFGGYFILKDTFVSSLGFAWYYEALGFAYGIILAQYQDKFVAFLKNKYFIKLFAFAICSCALGVLYLKYKPIYFYGEYLLKCLLGLAIIIFILIIVARFRFGNKVSVYLGKISIEVFLYHGFVITLLDRYTQLSSGVFIALTVLLTIIMASVINKLDTTIAKRLKK